MDAVLSGLTVPQLCEWMAYYQINPFGQDHTDFLIAQLTALLRNVNRQQGTEASKPSDFLPLYKPQQQDWQEMFAVIREAKQRAT